MQLLNNTAAQPANCMIRLDYQFMSKDKGYTRGKACKCASLIETYIRTGTKTTINKLTTETIPIQIQNKNK